jgi:hypothetical protein
MASQLLDPERCSKCGGGARIYKSYRARGYRLRRHKCRECGERWTSYQSRMDPKRRVTVKVPVAR